MNNDKYQSKKLLVGATGFVGSNLMAQTVFEGAYHSVDIKDAYGMKPDLLVYAGVRAEKYIANANPELDMAHIDDAFLNIERIDAKHVVLISTIDVYNNTIGSDEDSIPDSTHQNAYGRNRHALECKVRNAYSDKATIVRLPGLIGNGLKKNFVYDLIHVIPAMLTKQKYIDISELDVMKAAGINQYYQVSDNGFFKLRNHIAADEINKLKSAFESIGFTARSFTDSRAIFQFYDLNDLWSHIEKILIEGVDLVNLFPEPISAAETCYAVKGKDFVNELSGTPAHYDCRTKYAALFGRSDGYIGDKKIMLEKITKFAQEALVF